MYKQTVHKTKLVNLILCYMHGLISEVNVHECTKFCVAHKLTGNQIGIFLLSFFEQNLIGSSENK